MGKHLQFDLADLESALSRQAELVEQTLRTASRGLHERCLGSAAEVFSRETVINQAEVVIEEHCLDVLALHQPVAVDLRRVTAILKINNDLERIGDLALNLAERTESLVDFPTIEVPEKLDTMVQMAIEMLRDARQALISLDEQLAQDVCQRDDEVDNLNKQVIDELMDRMQSAPEKVSGYLHVFSASRIIERIADHATNIAEDVVYLVSGSITRHPNNRSA